MENCENSSLNFKEAISAMINGNEIVCPNNMKWKIINNRFYNSTEDMDGNFVLTHHYPVGDKFRVNIELEKKELEPKDLLERIVKIERWNKMFYQDVHEMFSTKNSLTLRLGELERRVSENYEKN